MEYIEDLIQKYHKGLINNSEIKELELWIKSDPKNEEYFQKRVQENFLIDSWAFRGSSDIRFEKLIRPVVNRKGTRFQRKIYKYAAILILALSVSGLTYLYFNSSSAETYDPGNIQLTFEDGKVLEIEEDSEKIITGSQGQKLGFQQYNLLNFTAGKAEPEKLSYNVVKVPDGKRLRIFLSDSTMVYLNGNTTLRFPTQFLSTGPREVMVIGEAYFTVKHNKTNPFIVHTSQLQVEVLGTSFNVNAYGENEHISTTLVEGSVKLIADNSYEILKPGELGAYSVVGKEFNVEEVIVANHIAWTENRLLFINEPFSSIMRKIERSYGVQIENNNPEIEKARFNGDFDISTENVEDVLNAFSEVDFFDYTIKNNKITIKK